MVQLIFKYEWLKLKRNVITLAIVAFTFVLGLYAIYYGYTEIEKQKQTIETVKASQKAQLKKISDGFLADTTTTEGEKQWRLSAIPGVGLYRHKYAVFFKPSALSVLSLGQRDLQPFAYPLSGMSLYYQLFQNEIANPLKLLVGNFDLAFIFIYLFPLLIIVFNYNILSKEKDLGLLPLLKSQSIGIKKIITVRVLFYFMLLSIIGFALNIIGFCAGGFGANYYAMFLWLLTTQLYVLFWFSVLFFIISFNKNSLLNATSAVGGWLFVLILLPAIITIIISISMPLNTNVLSGISRRTGVFDEEFDENNIKVIKEFIAVYPEYGKHPNLYTQNLSGKGFAAFTVLKDDKSKILVKNYQNQVSRRDEIAQYFNVINPAVTTQGIFDALAQTDLYAFQNFNNSVVSYHHQLVKFYHKKLFSNQQLTASDFNEVPHFSINSQGQNEIKIFGRLIILLLSAICLFFVANLIMKNKL